MSVVFNIIKDYLNGTFTVTDKVIETLNDLYYKPSLENYVLMPLLIYILKNQK